MRSTNLLSIDQKPTSRVATWGLMASLAGFSAALLVLLWLSLYTRYYADDFCTAGLVRQQGFWNAQNYWYTQWSGRFAFYFSVSLIELASARIAPFLPVITGGAWLVALAWVFGQLGELLGLGKQRWLFVVVSEIVLFATLTTLPNQFQSMFWQTGLITYVFPLVLLTVWFGLFLKFHRDHQANRKSWIWLGCAALAFWMGGFSETTVAMQTVVFGLGLVMTLLWVHGTGRRQYVWLWSASLLASGAAMAVIFFAPGNTVRQGLLDAPPGLLRIITFSMRNTAHIVGKYVLWFPLTALTSVLGPAVLGYLFHPGRAVSGHEEKEKLFTSKWFRGLVVIPVVCFLLVTAACAPTVYAMNAYPDDRVIVVPQYLIACTAAVWGFLLGWGLRERPSLGKGSLASPAFRTGMIVIILTLGIVAPAISILQTAEGVAQAQAYSQVWDIRDQTIAADVKQGNLNPTVKMLDSRDGLEEMGTDPNGWINRCAAWYYRVENITAQP